MGIKIMGGLRQWWEGTPEWLVADTSCIYLFLVTNPYIFENVKKLTVPKFDISFYLEVS